MASKALVKPERETPPRAWGRPLQCLFTIHTVRNTPTGVGKTHLLSGLPINSRKHPHGRGEDTLRGQARHLDQETPPRAWGRPRIPCLLPSAIGNTPTGVGKTNLLYVPSALAKKHPHGRGEDFSPAVQQAGGEETPPRAWGRLQSSSMQVAKVRNTPTGVGKTFRCGHDNRPNRKHPHGRGEDWPLVWL